MDSPEGLHQDLHLLVNGQPPVKGGGLPLPMQAARFFSGHGTRLAGEFRRTAPVTGAGDGLVIEAPEYGGSNRHVLAMKSYLERHLGEDLAGAWVHGSLAEGVEIPYSDFDALVIIRDEVCTDARRLSATARSLYGGLELMFRCDPLQHHGWFVLAERQMQSWPEHYLPAAAMRCAKSLLPGKSAALDIRLFRDPARMAGLTGQMADRIAADIDGGEFFENCYRLKGLLSRFMLMPALYLQGRQGWGVSKRESFALAKSDFAPAAWAVMDEVSALRRNWSCDLGPICRVLLRAASPVVWRYLVKRYSPPVPPETKRWLEEGAAARMRELALLMGGRQ